MDLSTGLGLFGYWIFQRDSDFLRISDLVLFVASTIQRCGGNPRLPRIFAIGCNHLSVNLPGVINKHLALGIIRSGVS